MRVVCVVDNSVLPLSAFWGEHGLAFWIESGGERMLFDTGASGTVLLHNLEIAGLSLQSLYALALSHSHPDHTGGLPALLKQRRGIPTYAHPDLFRPRYSRKKGEMQSKWLPLSPEALRQESEMHLSDAPQFIGEGVWTTGEILNRSEPEGRSAHHFVRSGEDWIADPYRDDISLVLETKAGLYLVCGCCHAGLLNTLAHVRRMFGKYPIGVMGGTHLIGASQEQLDHTVECLREMGSPQLHLNHCTGQPAYVALSQAFGDRVAHCPAGTVLEL
jgi:7,8-dihydropterin-6-yl-methyl-4-(beta-D-ribofuranosyl)aminobenzene 5'-phosphate synthase